MEAQAHPKADKRKLFKQIANKRVQRAIDHIRLVERLGKMAISEGNLSDQDVQTIDIALKEALNRCVKMLTSAATGIQTDVEFDLDKR